MDLNELGYFNEFVENGFESGLRKLVRRCLECDQGATLKCPVCDPPKICVQSTQTCAICPQRRCEFPGKSGLSIPTSTSSGGPNVGAIVGGIVGGLILVAIIVWVAWKFFIVPRRQRWGIASDETYEPFSEKEISDSTGSPPERESQFPRRSMASTTYTRGSNVIQIAFIPGITDRSGEDEALVPPVPPIPIRTASSTPQSPGSPYTDSAEDHYFMPDLRDSTYSGFTDDGASSFQRQSIAPSIAPSLLRQSVASTLNGAAHTVENPAPAQTAQRGRPLMVSVKSSAANSRSPSIPTVPQVDYEKYGQQKSNSPASYTPSVYSYKTASDALISPTHKLKTQTSTIPSIKVDTGSDLSRQQTPPQLIKPATSRNELRSTIEEATRKASQQPVHGGLGSVRRDPSPFSDEYRIDTP